MQSSIHMIDEDRSFTFIYDSYKLNQVLNAEVKFKDWISAFDYFFIGLEGATSGDTPLSIEESRSIMMSKIRGGSSYLPGLFIYKYLPRTEDQTKKMRLMSFAFEMESMFTSTYRNFIEYLLEIELVKQDSMITCETCNDIILEQYKYVVQDIYGNIVGYFCCKECAESSSSYNKDSIIFTERI